MKKTHGITIGAQISIGSGFEIKSQSLVVTDNPNFSLVSHVAFAIYTVPLIDNTSNHMLYGSIGNSSQSVF